MSVLLRFDERFWWRALGVSLCLHLLFALFLPIWNPLQSAGLQPVESLTFAHIMRAEIERPHAAALPAAAPITKRIAPRILLDRTRSEMVANKHTRAARPIVERGPRGTQLAAAPRSAQNRSAVPYAQAAATQNPAAAVEHRAVQTPHPDVTVASQSVASTGTADRGGVMPFTAQQDPVLDPAVHAQLSKLVHTHVTLTVTVDEDGHTKAVKFDPPLDADTERQMQSLLASASWDAAVCGGGVSCEGVATIKL